MRNIRFYQRLMMVLLFSLIASPGNAFYRSGGLNPENFEPLNRIPENILHIENGESVILVEKVPQKLYLLGYDGTYLKLMDLNCSTGKVPGRKRVSGDRKTPEGVYFITKRHLKKYLSPIYGSRALPLNYPNQIDQHAGRSGSAIWLHGTNKVLKERDSNGCIVLNDPDIDRLDKNISLEKTPVIIAEKFNYVVPAVKNEKAESVKALIHGWKSALENGTYQEIAGFYHPHCLPDTVWWKGWKQLRKKLKKNQNNFSISIQALSVYKDSDVYVAVFDLETNNGHTEIPAGTKKIYLTEKKEGLKINFISFN